MRITVNLSLFLHDHRSVAKIFINQNIKCIKDVEDRITKVFQIRNFYLKCDNQYLPPSEDIKILNNDDIVWALPKNDSNKYEVETQEEVVLKKKKKKKKKKEAREDTEDENISMEVKPESSFEIKKKKTSKSKTKKTNKGSYLDNENSGIKDCESDSRDDNKFDETNDNSPSKMCLPSVKTLVDTFENNKLLQRNFGNFSPINENKKINIVKTIIISSNDRQTSQSSDIQPCCSNSSGSLPESEGSSLTASETSKITSQKLNNTQISFTSDENVLETDKSVLVNDNADKGVTEKKRKRTRIRKRKRANKNTNVQETTVSESTVYNLIPRPLLTNSAGRHVRFKDDSPDSSLNTVNNFDESVNTTEQVEKTDILKTVNNNELTEDFISKQPVLEGAQPKIGDILAFKTLRISESYTPEMSSRIVGKVCDYNSSTMEITFDIISGQDQCLEPQGKFSLDLKSEEDKTTEQSNANTKLQSVWSNIFDPRLLFP